MTINSLIAQVGAGTMTVAEAVDVIDVEGMTYAIEYFSPQTEAELPYWDLLAEWRLRHPKPAPTAQPAPVETVPEKSGQLWEPCGRCGAEPVYMPLHLCADCWPQ